MFARLSHWNATRGNATRGNATRRKATRGTRGLSARLRCNPGGRRDGAGVRAIPTFATAERPEPALGKALARGVT